MRNGSLKVTPIPPVHAANLVANSGNTTYGVEHIISKYFLVRRKAQNIDGLEKVHEVQYALSTSLLGIKTQIWSLFTINIYNDIIYLKIKNFNGWACSRALILDHVMRKCFRLLHFVCICLCVHKHDEPSFQRPTWHTNHWEIGINKMWVDKVIPPHDINSG